jgi:hypothetical protein
MIKTRIKEDSFRFSGTCKRKRDVSVAFVTTLKSGQADDPHYEEDHRIDTVA